MFRAIFVYLSGSAIAVAMSGCGGGGERLPTVPASGIVTLQGAPVEGAHVALAPQDATGGRSAFAQTDAQGHFQLMTLKPQDGALPGSYRVKISKEVSEGGMSVEEAQAYFEKHGQPPPEAKVKDLLPAKYKDFDTSGLTADVTQDGPNEFKFDLTP